MFSMERRRAYSCVPPAIALFFLNVAKFDTFRFLPSALPSRLAFP
jgi:hypothetical protein